MRFLISGGTPVMTWTVQQLVKCSLPCYALCLMRCVRSDGASTAGHRSCKDLSQFKCCLEM